MAQDKKLIRDSYPIPAYNYRVTVGGSTIGFSEVSGLNLDVPTVTYKHGLSFAMGFQIVAGMPGTVRLTMKKGLAVDQSFLGSWVQETTSGSSKDAARDILIDLCDGSGNPVVRWIIRRALAIKLAAPTFDANSNGVAVESLELIAQSIEVDYHPQ
jgi:phage tail-like protein